MIYKFTKSVKFENSNKTSNGNTNYSDHSVHLLFLGHTPNEIIMATLIYHVSIAYYHEKTLNLR